MMFLVQLARSEHPDLKTVVGTDTVQLFWCTHGCYEVEPESTGTTLQEGQVLVAYGTAGVAPIVAPQSTEVLPARAMERRAAIDLPDDGEARIIWWGQSYQRFYDTYDFDVYIAMLDEHPGTNADATKIGGVPSWRQGAQRAICKSCRRHGFWAHDDTTEWEQGETGAANVRGEELLLQYVDDDAVLTDAGGIYVLACRCGNITIRHDFG
jgi:hypothetical protein